MILPNKWRVSKYKVLNQSLYIDSWFGDREALVGEMIYRTLNESISDINKTELQYHCGLTRTILVRHARWWKKLTRRVRLGWVEWQHEKWWKRWTFYIAFVSSILVVFK